MLTGLAVIFLSGLIFGLVSKKMHLPALIGMIAAGIIALCAEYNRRRGA